MLRTGRRRSIWPSARTAGVGCATIVQAQAGKIVGMVPDQQSPVNRGVQCIKGLTAWEPTYQDRLTSCLVRKDMSDPLTDHVSATKGRFDPEVWREVSYEEASKIAAEKTAAIAKKFGGNSVGLYGQRPAHRRGGGGGGSTSRTS